MAIKINPDHLEALINLAILLATSDAPRLNEAKEHYEYALRLGCGEGRASRNDFISELIGSNVFIMHVPFL